MSVHTNIDTITVLYNHSQPKYIDLLVTIQLQFGNSLIVQTAIRHIFISGCMVTKDEHV